MDIRQRQSVLSFAGGKLVISSPSPKMPEAAPATMATKKKKSKKPKKRKNPPAVDGASAASSNPPKKNKRARPSETKKRLRSFVKKKQE